MNGAPVEPPEATREPPEAGIQATAPAPATALIADLPFLRDLGFVLVQGDRPDRARGPRLLVGFRDRPTYAHFDPEWALAWIIRDGRGRRIRLDREHPAPATGFAWGVIHVFDRLGVSNSFVSFGGSLTGAELDPGLSVVRFASRAPILRWIGHSQPLDPRAANVESFFARLMIPIDFQPGIEARVGATDPVTLYAAMIAECTARTDQPQWLGREGPAEQWAHAERQRLRNAEPAAWAEAERLLRDLGLATPAAAARSTPAVTPGRTRGEASAGSDW